MTKELKRNLQKLRQKMAAMLNPLDPGNRDLRLAQSAESDDLFARWYLPFWTDQATPDFHQEISEGYTRRLNEIQVNAAPRGHGKTTRSRIAVARRICHAQHRSVLACSASESIVEELVTPLFIALSENPRIQQDFGDVVKKGHPLDFQTHKDVIFRAKGRDERKRGPRVDLAWIDDIEDAQQARSKDQVDKVLDVILEEIYNMLIPPSAGGSTFMMLGTILSRKSALARLLNINNAPEPEFPEVLGTVWKAIMEDEHGQEYSLWPERFPLEYLYQIRQRIGTRRFNKEFQNNPMDEDSIFQEAWFQGFHALELLELSKEAAA
jgi:hypothetical protein